MASAIIHGVDGRLGRAFLRRLLDDGFEVVGVGVQGRWAAPWIKGDRPWLFDFAYEHGEPEAHLHRAFRHIADRRTYGAVFVPSSWWVGDGSPYGTAKLVVEQLVKVTEQVGPANVVTDRIGYFPGDDIAPDPRDPFYDKLVTGDALYERIMTAMRKAADW